MIITNKRNNKEQVKQKKEAKKKALKTQNRNTRHFTKTKNITAMVYYLIMITIGLLILLSYLGVLDFSLGG